MPMTIREWRQQRTYVADVGDVIKDDGLKDVSGWVYPGLVYIMQHSQTPLSTLLIQGNCDKVDDLENNEVRLYDWACEERIL